MERKREPFPRVGVLGRRRNVAGVCLSGSLGSSLRVLRCRGLYLVIEYRRHKDVSHSAQPAPWQVQTVIVVCPNCKAENRLADTLERNTVYQCYVCKTRFDRISTTNFKKVAACILLAWWAAPLLIWVSRPIGESAPAYSFQSYIATLFFWSTVFLLPLVVLATVFFLKEGFGHRKFTGVSPKGFRALVCASVLGCSACVVGITLFARAL